MAAVVGQPLLFQLYFTFWWWCLSHLHLEVLRKHLCLKTFTSGGSGRIMAGIENDSFALTSSAAQHLVRLEEKTLSLGLYLERRNGEEAVPLLQDTFGVSCLFFLGHFGEDTIIAPLWTKFKGAGHRGELCVSRKHRLGVCQNGKKVSVIERHSVGLRG